MIEEKLHRLLTAAAEDVRPSHPALRGWERARRTRRARRAAGAAALAVVLLASGATLALGLADAPAPTRPASPTPGPVPSASPVQRPPAELSYPGDPLSRLGDPVGATLSARPVRQALALYQPVDHETYTGGVIRVLGDDGIVRSLDVVTPSATRDRHGNEAPALKPGQLSPDGRTAVFPQTNELILVDLTTATVRRVPLDGYLELVVWIGDRVLVGGDDRTYLVDPVSREAGRVSGSIWETVAPDPATRPTRVAETSGMRDGLTLRSRAMPAGTLQDQRRISSAALPRPFQVNEFYGRGWQRGGRIAQAAWITNGVIDGAEGVAVLDARTGAVTQLLDLGRDNRSKGCCEVLGWDGDDVLLRLDGQLVRWRPETGEVTGVVRALAGMVALAG
ncbi:hypothetical protein [Micromonospora sp. DT47]|uniref:hypothetical protein n=1 Tax=Micromonospora sp. DT47 TaxID=3393431 RepID=UPI003CEA5CAF